MSTDHYARAGQLLREVRDGHTEGSDTLSILAAAQVHATLAQTAPAADAEDQTAYRAKWHGIRLGLYTTREAARMHCQVEAAGPDQATHWEADPDDPGGAEDLCTADGLATGYSVTRVTIYARYTPGEDA